jgi:cytochrome bd ubiquinol oxidase subunit II
MLALIWAGIIGFCIIMYVLLDGFTLGTGILMPMLSAQERDIAISMILPTWDGNQTWLVLGLASLYGAFPLAFSVLLPALYMPLLLMAILLLFRGVVFEFRLKSQKGKLRWDWIFFLSSLFITIIQGLIVGKVVKGFGSHQAFISGFSVLTAAGLIVAYTLLGSTRLILKCEGRLQKKMFRWSRANAMLLIAAVVLVCFFTPFVHPKLYHLWVTVANWPLLFWLPLLTIGLSLSLLASLRRRHEILPYWLAVLLVLCPFFGFIVNLYPYIVPYQITIQQAASPNNTLVFLLFGATVMLPVLLVYTGYAYHIFRGKVKNALHY